MCVIRLFQWILCNKQRCNPEMIMLVHSVPLQCRHNEHHWFSNHRRLYCLPNHLFRRISKKTSRLRVTGLCEGNPPVTGGFWRYLKDKISNLVLLTDIFKAPGDNALRLMPQDLTGVKSTLVQVMLWCHQATSHHLNQYWQSSVSKWTTLCRQNFQRHCTEWKYLCFDKISLQFVPKGQTLMKIHHLLI